MWYLMVNHNWLERFPQASIVQVLICDTIQEGQYNMVVGEQSEYFLHMLNHQGQARLLDFLDPGMRHDPGSLAVDSRKSNISLTARRHVNTSSRQTTLAVLSSARLSLNITTPCGASLTVGVQAVYLSNMAAKYNNTPLDEIQFRRPEVIQYWGGFRADTGE